MKDVLKRSILTVGKMKLYPRSRKDICLFGGYSSKRGCEGFSVIVFHNLQSQFLITSLITNKLFVYPYTIA